MEEKYFAGNSSKIKIISLVTITDHRLQMVKNRHVALQRFIA